MAYPIGHYGGGIRGLGDPLTAIMGAATGDLIGIDASTTSLLPYLNWASPGQIGVASNSPSPQGSSNGSGTAPTTGVGINQWVTTNSSGIMFIALAVLAYSILKK